jgi:multicomponent Na+:H+ antiporter subunit F
MTIAGVQLVSAAGTVALTLISAALFLAALRLFRGPSLPDRVVALELIAGLMVGMIAVVSIVAEQTILIDVAITLALVGFLGAVAFARYMELGTRRDDVHAGDEVGDAGDSAVDIEDLAFDEPAGEPVER